MSNLQDALWYVEEIGWSVFPVHTPCPGGGCSCRQVGCEHVGKHPRTPNGVLDATTDKGQVTAWWERWPDANIGIATGQRSNLLVLDVDAKSGGLTSLAAWEKYQGEPIETVVAQTGGGGLHYFFTYPPENNVGNRTGVRPGLDIRGEGGYVVVPPSLHESGNLYVWELSPKWLQPAGAEWLLPLLRRRKPVNKEIPDSIPQSQRNDTLFRFACVMQDRGFSKGAIGAALLVENQARCLPPLTEQEVREIAASAERYVPTHRIVGLDFDDGLIIGAKLLAHKFPEIEWVVDEMLPPGLVLFGGRAKLGKSLFLLHLARAVCGGETFLDRAARQGNVLYISLEDGPRRIQSRMQEQGWGVEQAQHMFLIFDDFRLDVTSLSALETYILRENLRLVIIDSLNRARGRDSLSENEAELAHLLYPLSEIGQARDCTIILLHHHRKGATEDVVSDFRGSSAIGGAGDTLIGLYPPRDGISLLKITGRDMEDRSETIYLDNLQWYAAGQLELRPTQVQQKLLDSISQHVEVDAEILTEEFAISRQAMIKHLTELVKKGWVVQKGKKGKRKLYLLDDSVAKEDWCTE